MKIDLKRRAALLLLIAVTQGISGCTAAAVNRPRDARTAQPTLVVVVRHAERAAVEGDDPPLSPAGARRAEHLAEAVRGLGLTAIYATQRQRTQLTAQPTATQLGLPIQILPIGNAEEHAASQAAEILARHAGGTVLVVGHSNTVPLIVRALGGPDVGMIEDTEFDHFFLLVIPADGPVRALRVRYGAATPAS